MKLIMQRKRRAKKTRATIKRLGVNRLAAFKSNQHTYAQLINAEGKVLATASTLSPEYKQLNEKQNKSDAAAWVGAAIAKKVLGLGLKEVAFDRSGFKYHGRIVKLADAARAAGLTF